jgi:hypothetical protein
MAERFALRGTGVVPSKPDAPAELIIDWSDVIWEAIA